MRHRFLNPAGLLRALASPDTVYPYYTVAMQSSCFPGLKGAPAYLLLNRRSAASMRTPCRSHKAERGTRQAGGSEQSRYPSFHRPGVIDIGGAKALYQFSFIGADAKVKPDSDGDCDEGRKR